MKDDINRVLDNLNACKAAQRKLRRYGKDVKGAWKSVEDPGYLIYMLDVLDMFDNCDMMDKISIKLLSMMPQGIDKIRLSNVYDTYRDKGMFSDWNMATLIDEITKFFITAGGRFPKAKRIALCNYIRRLVTFSIIEKQYIKVWEVEPEYVFGY